MRRDDAASSAANAISADVTRSATEASPHEAITNANNDKKT
ncbi:hypothetical protein [uncultured Duncaniella sp.]|nr:hypothetical protein [uncultured Duncaniella sp.]